MGESFNSKGKKGSKKKRKQPAVIEENDHSLDEELNDDMIEHALETESDEEDISPLLLQGHPDQHHDELCKENITMNFYTLHIFFEVLLNYRHFQQLQYQCRKKTYQNYSVEWK